MNEKLPLISCDQKLSDLSPTSCGRFCHSCLKEVIDFRQMSKEEILAVHQSTRGKLCGMYKEEQVKVIKTISPKHPSMQGWKAWYLGLLGILFAETADAQEVSDSTKVEQMEITKEGIRIGDNIYSYHGGVIRELPEIDSFILEGQIVWGDESLIGATVHIKNTIDDGVLTDINGHFQLDLTEQFEKQSQVEIQINYMGYIPKVLNVQKQGFDQKGRANIFIQMEEDFIIGEVVIVKSGWHNRMWYGIKRFFRFEWLRKE
ncbi:MAG: carboxypeptidase-like regulatory domain-containing protein [Saprospiraceae bacterium]|nr:carboxypeptidase-like regulatory domain-containing protein [Saprospiraceae bacterium]